jgi:GT2 family glycosyltransferase
MRADGPLFSVVMPVFNPSPIWLEAAIESVLAQTYPRWELCIADDSSTNPEVRALLERFSQQDPRIRVIFREANGHIAAASNTALAEATGDFVALLDHDDELSSHALACVAEAISRNPGVALLYSDEDKIDENGQRYDPYFKCDFNYELFLAQNMISHLGVYRKAVVDAVGGFREGFEGSQDYDLALRVLEHSGAQNIVHIPRVLYHWRATPGSTARDSGEKAYSVTAARRSVQEHLTRSGRGGLVSPAPMAPMHHRVRYALPDVLPLVSIVIPTRDRADLLSVCLESLFSVTHYPNYEVIVIDNGSSEAATHDLFARLPQDRARVIRDEAPFNFSRLNNLAANAAQGAVIVLMNNDIQVTTPDWIEEMLSFALQPDIGCVGAKLWYPDRRLQHGGVITGIGGVAGHAHKFLPDGHPGYFNRAVLHQSFSAVTAACLMVRRAVWDQVGGLDESLTVAFNDVDLCLRIREAGYRNVWTPYAEMIHHESASRGMEDTPERIARFETEIQFMKARWADKLLRDPAYNPNLTLDLEDFGLAWPPQRALES